eukprot:TRINITY_DN6728_c0_g3_i3.p1 TRINITY_DN6728_c0_g3~~TRINITY_DN6728_c0_g3_i3.p1  ORF type:complete len:656 (+),score=108.57 TRINITY_DN6728_c0_g3_i3:122-2089(+)
MDQNKKPPKMKASRKRALLRKMSITYMNEGLTTITDLRQVHRSPPSPPLPPSSSQRQASKKARLSSIGSSGNTLSRSASPSVVSRASSVSSNSSCSTSTSKTPSVPKATSTSKASSPASNASASTSNSKSKTKVKKGSAKVEKTAVKPKFDALIRNLPLEERQLMHARNGIPLLLSEGVEELPMDFSSMEKYSDKKLNEFEDVNDGEKEIMKMWNKFIAPRMGRGVTHLPSLLEQFVAEKGKEIAGRHLFRNAVLLITSFQDSGILDQVDSFAAKNRLQVHVAEYAKSTNLIPLQNKVSLHNGLGTSAFYGTTPSANSNKTVESSDTTETANQHQFRRSLDDHLPCRRNLSPDLASRTLSLDTRLEDERPRIVKKGGRSRLNSKGGGSSPGRGSPVRGTGSGSAATTSLGSGGVSATTNHQISTNMTTSPNKSDSSSFSSSSNSGGGLYRRSLAVGKRAFGAVFGRKGLWQSDSHNISANNKPVRSQHSFFGSSRLDFTQLIEGSQERQHQQITAAENVITLTDTSDDSNDSDCQIICSHNNQENLSGSQGELSYEFKRRKKPESPNAFRYFLDAFDNNASQSGFEDLEAEVPGLVVMPKSSKPYNKETLSMKLDGKARDNELKTINSLKRDSAEMRIDVPSSHKRSFRTKTNEI